MSALQSKITELMAQKKVTAVDIEKSTGLKRNTLYSITSGSSKSPTVHNLQLIAKGLNVSMEALMLDGGVIEYAPLTGQQMMTFSDATRATIDFVLGKDYNFTLEKLIFLIKEIYQYSIKIDPPVVDNRFIQWLVDNLPDQINAYCTLRST